MKSHMVGAILTLVICLPAGIVPLIYACKVNNKLAQGDIAGAQAASKKAKLWLNISIAILGTIIVLSIFMSALGPAISSAQNRARAAQMERAE